MPEYKITGEGEKKKIVYYSHPLSTPLLSVAEFNKKIKEVFGNTRQTSLMMFWGKGDALAIMRARKIRSKKKRPAKKK